MRKNALLPIALLLTTTGCAYIRDAVCPKPEIPEAKGQRQPPETRRAQFCPKEVCTVTVTVDENCTVRVDPYYLVMAGRGNGTIVWTITSKEGEFAAAPIRWKQPAAEAVFKSSGKAPTTEIAFKNDRTIGSFNYGITVKRGDRTCPELDPTVINDWP